MPGGDRGGGEAQSGAHRVREAGGGARGGDPSLHPQEQRLQFDLLPPPLPPPAPSPDQQALERGWPHV